jgi:hypothetical protein
LPNAFRGYVSVNEFYFNRDDIFEIWWVVAVRMHSEGLLLTVSELHKKKYQSAVTIDFKQCLRLSQNGVRNGGYRGARPRPARLIGRSAQPPNLRAE